MRRLLVATLLLISSSGLWAQTTDPLGPKTSESQESQSAQTQKTQSEQSKTTGFLEFSFPTSSVSTHIDPEFGSETSEKNSSPFFLGISWGLNAENSRTHGGLSFERLDMFSVNGESQNRWNLGFKLSYDQCFKPYITDFYLSGALLYYPVQGQRFTSNGTEFSPKGGLGFEASIGWISPLDVAFNFGYKSVLKDYSYSRYDTIMGQTDERRSSMNYGWVFVTASIGRY